MDDVNLALVMARSRIAIGFAAVVAPGFSAKVLSGHSEQGIEPLLARMLGARDLALGLGTVIALDKGAPVRGWLEAAALADTADCVTSLLGRSRMSKRAFVGTVALAAASAASGAFLARRLDPAPPAHPHQPEAIVTGHPE
jgi:hypothetical protein